MEMRWRGDGGRRGGPQDLGNHAQRTNCQAPQSEFTLWRVYVSGMEKKKNHESTLTKAKQNENCIEEIAAQGIERS